MPLATNGLPPDVIREMMPPYRLGADLLAGTLAALFPVPPETQPALPCVIAPTMRDPGDRR